MQNKLALIQIQILKKADLEGELEDARSTAEEALDEVEDLKSELEALRGQMENGD